MARSWPTMTFLTSNSAGSSSARLRRAADGGRPSADLSACGCGGDGSMPRRRTAWHRRALAEVKAAATATCRYRRATCALLVVEDEVDLAEPWPGPASRGLRGRRRLRRARPPRRASASTPYDLVCLDLNLPDVDGLEVCRRLRTDPTLAPDRRRARAPGADADRPGHASTTGSSASTRAPTTTWSSRSPSPSWRPGSAPCCAATPAAPAPCCGSGELELDTRALRGPPGRRRARPHGQGVRPPALLHDPRRRGALARSTCSSTCGTSTPTRSPTPCGSRSARCAASSHRPTHDEPLIETVVGAGYRLLDVVP